MIGKNELYFKLFLIISVSYFLLLSVSGAEKYEIILKAGWNAISIPYETFKIVAIEGNVHPIGYIYDPETESYKRINLYSLSSQQGAIWVYSFVDGSKIIVEGEIPFSYNNITRKMFTSPQKSTWNFIPLPKGGLDVSELLAICENISIYYYNTSDNCWYFYKASSKEYKRYCKGKWEFLGNVEDLFYDEGLGIWVRVDKNCHSRRVKLALASEICNFEFQACEKDKDCCPGLACINGACLRPHRFFCEDNKLIYRGIKKNVTQCKYCCVGIEDCGIAGACCKDEPCKSKIEGRICPYEGACMERQRCELLGGVCLPNFPCDLRILSSELESSCCCYIPPICKKENERCLKDSECCRGLQCVEGVCKKPVKPTTTTLPYCSGKVKLTLIPLLGKRIGLPEWYKEIIFARVSGLQNCKGTAYIKDAGGCESGKTIATCNISGSGCVAVFDVPKEPGKHVYYACFDINSDGKYSEEEYDYAEFIVKGVTTTTIKIPSQQFACDSINYTSCEKAYDFGNSSDSKVNMCGVIQYYKVSTPKGKKCNVTWSLKSQIPLFYHLYVNWKDSCPTITNFDCSSIYRMEMPEKASCSITGFSGTTYALVYRSKIPIAPVPYNITVSIENCVDIA
jgi:hypothetical protein